MRKLLLQKMAQLIDKHPKNKELKKDYLELKLNDDDKFYLTMRDKWK